MIHLQLIVASCLLQVVGAAKPQLTYSGPVGSIKEQMVYYIDNQEMMDQVMLLHAGTKKDHGIFGSSAFNVDFRSHIVVYIAGGDYPNTDRIELTASYSVDKTLLLECKTRHYQTLDNAQDTCPFAILIYEKRYPTLIITLVAEDRLGVRIKTVVYKGMVKLGSSIDLKQEKQ